MAAVSAGPGGISMHLCVYHGMPCCAPGQLIPPPRSAARGTSHLGIWSRGKCAWQGRQQLGVHPALGGPIGVAGGCLSRLVGADGLRSDRHGPHCRVAICCSSTDWPASGSCGMTDRRGAKVRGPPLEQYSFARLRRPPRDKCALHRSLRPSTAYSRP